mgnify:CR=1 FL=1|tara:strand:- start:1876 stop:2136 length:261 start_codon:yes stop_codon:yes gene_type:complete
MIVSNMRTRNGNAAANQFIIHEGGKVHFQSYSSRIATIDETGEVVLYDPYWDMYSATTNNYLLTFLNEYSIKDVREKVKEGIYTVK